MAVNGGVENVDVSSALNYTPTSAKTYDEFVKDNYSKTGNTPIGSTHSVFGDIANFFSGERDRYESAYNTYLQNINAENAAKANDAANKAAKEANDLAWQRELKATQDARAWDKMMSDTQYQRAVADLKKAGLNPWLALQNGVSGSEVPSSGKSQASTARVSQSKSSAYESKKSEKTNGMRDISLLLFALARLAA